MSAVQPTKGLVIAAIGFDERTDTVSRAAAALARRFGLELRLVSVVEPVPFDLLAFDSPAYLGYPPVNLEIEVQRVHEQEKQLAALARNLGDDLKISACVLTGAINQMLINEAVSRRANLIVAGFSPAAYRLQAAGFSTALGLMHHAPLPVLAVCGDRPFDAKAQGLRIVLADDLREGSQEAARKAYELAAQVPGSHLRHVHVHGDLRELIRRSWQELRRRAPGAAGGSSSIADEEAAFGAELSARKARMTTQGQPFRTMAEAAGVKIESDLRSGRVDEELRRAITDADANLVIFGRHRLLHPRPQLIGQVPFRTMLHYGANVLVVPAGADLYANLPFPGRHES